MSSRHHLLNENLAWHDRKKWNDALSLLKDFCKHHRQELAEIGDTAMELKNMIDSVDRYIQENTSRVCPDCRKVCCINRHGYYDYLDLIYVTLLGLTPPNYGDNIEDTAPCQFLSSAGCRIQRSLRPFRCNWHFCSELIVFMNAGPARNLREFNNSFRELQALRREMAEQFFMVLSCKT
jgi:hypothetical protein